MNSNIKNFLEKQDKELFEYFQKETKSEEYQKKMNKVIEKMDLKQIKIKSDENIDIYDLLGRKIFGVKKDADNSLVLILAKDNK